MKYLAPVSLMVVALFAFALSGCGSKPADPTGSSTPAASDTHGDHDHGDHAEHGESALTDMDKMKAELAKLSAEDAASAALLRGHDGRGRRRDGPRTGREHGKLLAPPTNHGPSSRRSDPGAGHRRGTRVRALRPGRRGQRARWQDASPDRRVVRT